MIIKVSGIIEMNFYNNYNQRSGERQPQTKFYQPQTAKEEVKQDFGLLLDTELKRLRFDKII